MQWSNWNCEYLQMSHYYTLAVIFSIGLFSEGAILCIALTSMEVVPSNLAGTGQALSAASAQLSES